MENETTCYVLSWGFDYDQPPAVLGVYLSLETAEAVRQSVISDSKIDYRHIYIDETVINPNSVILPKV